MLRKKFRESLTVRIFLITALILFSAAAVTFGLIAWATPVTYTAVMSSDLARRADELVKKLAETDFDQCGPLLDEFFRFYSVDVLLTDSKGNTADTGSRLAVQPLYEDESTMVSAADGTAVIKEDTTVTWPAGADGAEGAVTVTTSGQSTIAAKVRFADRDDVYYLYITPRVQAENLAVRALIQMAPWLLLLLLLFSLICALVYSKYITRPIVRLSKIAGKMAQLDFNWECKEQRGDEIGKLGRSLNSMALRLSTALADLKEANHALRGEVEQEREMDRQRTAFFSAASHELKTPVTILKGQLSGMLEGVDVYKNRDKYLLRSLQVAGRMEKLIQEMLAISRMESGFDAVKQESVELSKLIERQISQDEELLTQKGQCLIASLMPGVTVMGDAGLLGKVVENLLSNASLYSPEGAKIHVWCGWMQGKPALTVENTGAHIREESIPHLFEAFYREESSRNRSTGGSGLGLYLVQMILTRSDASCEIKNTENGVLAAVRFLA